jgi:hypothetical protein
MVGGRRAACHNDTNLQSFYFINIRTCNALKVLKTCFHIESSKGFFFYNIGFYEETRNYILIFIFTAYPPGMNKYTYCVRNFISCVTWTVTAFDTKLLELISASWCSVPKILQSPTFSINRFLVFDTESFFEKLVGLPVTTRRLARRGFADFRRKQIFKTPESEL